MMPKNKSCLKVVRQVRKRSAVMNFAVFFTVVNWICLMQRNAELIKYEANIDDIRCAKMTGRELNDLF